MSAESERRTETIPEWKRREVDELVGFIESYDSIGIVDVTGIASRQLQDMRAGLHGTAELRMSRNTLLRLALEEVDDGLEVLVDHLGGHVGLIGTNANPFGLYGELEASKTSAPINAGEVAPNDIVIPEGDTGMDPGPFVGDLQSVGAAAQIMEGSIQVTEESVVAEAGEVVSDELANVLAELGIEPKEVGLDLRVVYSDGVLFEADELEIDVDQYREDIVAAAAGARNLSVNAGYPTDRTIRAMIAAGSADATALGRSAAVESPSIVDDLVAQADAQLRALAARIDDEEALPEELRGVSAPAETEAPAEAETETETETDSETETESETEADADDDEDDDDDDAAGEGLGEMFG